MSLDDKIAAASAALEDAARRGGSVALATSFGAEDMVVLDLISRLPKGTPKIEVFTLDTGRLPPETYELWAEAEARYQVRIKPFYPDTAAVERYVRLNGINGFYDSVAQRKDCCHVRKVEPLRRALAGKSGWITGLRREQAPTRQNLAVEELDTDHGIIKFNPLLDWTWADVWSYRKRFAVPVSKLHDRGYPSIGCAPCTRAIKPGEELRAGRWWWEDPSGKECGLHPVRREAVSTPQDTATKVAA